MIETSTLPQLLRSAASQHPDKVFVHATTASGAQVAVTFRQMQQRSQRIAAGLLAHGIGYGDRIAVAAPNHLEWLELLFGAVRIGAIVVTLNVRYRASELAYMLNNSGARMIVTAARDGDFDLRSFYAGFRDRIPRVEQIFFPGDNGAQSFDNLATSAADGQLAAAQRTVQADDPAVVLYTSGTTGQPKGAVLTHASLTGAARAQATHYGTAESDSYLCVLPLNHVGGLTCSITAALVTCSTVVMQPTFSPAAALSAIEQHGITVVGAVPTVWQLMVSHEDFARTKTHSVRMAIVGGSNLEPALARRLTQAIPGIRLANLYGLSEVSGGAVGSLADDCIEQISHSLGVPYPGVETRVVDTHGNAVADGAQGELQLRGPGTAAGYWQMPEQTAATFLPDGWVATGDMVSRESDGHVRLLGRRKEMFVQGGYNVYPVEVENVLTTHPGVFMAAGVGVPDAVLGEVGCYHVVRRAGVNVTADELHAHCARSLADYKVPRQFVFVDQLPLTATGKVAKSKLHQQSARRQSPD